ncbi:MAG TPA: hypothetical protein VEZ90_11905, partial [Blastocatellia bacterium]|nr:hypothetical protein [Blastocatellia bacterium]
SGMVTERAQIGSALLESILGIKRFTGNVWAQGSQDMILTPTGNSGNYFSQQDRRASRTEWMEIFSPAPIDARGKHNLKIGSEITRTTNRGDFSARPVDILDNGGDLIKRIQFVNGSPFNRRDLETTFFAEDHYVINPNLSMDLGLRFERQGITETIKIAPRGGIAWAPFGPSNTVIRGGFGLFYDRVPLDVYSFASYPEQLVTTFAPDGRILSGPTLFANITDRALRSKNPFIRSGDTAGNFAPYSATWNVEVDQPINRMLRVKASYLQSNSSGVVIFTPEKVDGRDALVLGGGGQSTYRQLELVARLHMSETREMFFSYVHARSQGDVNQFNNYLGNFPFPVIRSDVYSNLPGDLPNRFLAWGVLSLPWKMQISPLVEYRNGFPYAKVDAAQNFVGLPFTTRFPNFYSFDARISKDIKVNDKYALRLSVSGYNITNHFNPSAVFSNIAAPQLGVFFGDYKRHLTADFDVIF